MDGDISLFCPQVAVCSRRISPDSNRIVLPRNIPALRLTFQGGFGWENTVRSMWLRSKIHPGCSGHELRCCWWTQKLWIWWSTSFSYNGPAPIITPCVLSPVFISLSCESHQPLGSGSVMRFCGLHKCVTLTCVYEVASTKMQSKSRTGLTLTCCKRMNHISGLCCVMILEVVVRRFDVFDFFLFSSLCCSPGRFKWRQRHQIQPPSLNKMTTADDEGHLIWHRADCRDAPPPPADSCPREHCRATSKKGCERCTSKTNGPGWNRKPELQVLLICSYITPGVGCCVSAMSRCQLCSVMQFWTCMSEPREIFRTPPLAVISFYNQQMQIRNGQPINHSPAAEYWVAAASKHIMESIWIRPQTPWDVYMPIWDTLNPFNFHLHSSRLIGPAVICPRSRGTTLTQLILSSRGKKVWN